jgi:4a-hydroxytetrahydrobiopterin dehydratase|tara:strand:+ start:716 stop:1069 length:354 start_codon:yes stop_codon:yes gene_type:complete
MKPTTNLKDFSCKATPASAAAVSDADLKTLGAQIPEWSLENHDGILQLARTFKCSNFLQALSIANQIGDIAESNDHHPALVVEWGKIKVTWWSHSINGLHHNDFVMAAKTDEIYKTT